MVDHQQLAGRANCKADNAVRRVCEFSLPCDLLAIVLHAPNLPGSVVSIDVRAIELRQLVAAIHDSAR